MSFFSLPMLLLLVATTTQAQLLQGRKSFTKADTLRGSNTPERTWWNVLRYDLSVRPDYDSRTISGRNTIRLKATGGGANRRMQIDLQVPMIIDSVQWRGRGLPFAQSGNVWYVSWPNAVPAGDIKLDIYFHGTPRAAKNPPWDGGWIWKKDAKGRPWMSVAVQGLGASAWYPCKDYQGDEPDAGASLTVQVPDSLVAVANGKLTNKVVKDGLSSYTWNVTNPINSYNLVPYIGFYSNFTETYAGEKGKLPCSYWVLDYNLEKARKQFTQAPMTLKAFEHWWGPFPWYEDGFKLVESPHLGMEHQSAVAYGNRFENGYLGKDRSGTGVGDRWDFIIVHEVGHEWFANSITTRDIADMWVHEGFTSYGEVLFSEYYYGKKDGDRYLQGTRKNIKNDQPIIGQYGVNSEGSGDMYNKGSAMLHTIRQIIGDDVKFRSLLRGLNKDFYHRIVTSAQVEEYMIRKSGKNLAPVFNQYLRTIDIPVLEYRIKKDTLSYRWANCIAGFNMPVAIVTGGARHTLHPLAERWTTLPVPGSSGGTIEADPNYYIKTRKTF
jgi:aminopeptidase N